MQINVFLKAENKAKKIEMKLNQNYYKARKSPGLKPAVAVAPWFAQNKHKGSNAA